MGKRGQVTYFIVVGIIILLGLGLVFYTNYQAETADLGVVLEESTGNIPLELAPVKDFVKSCLEKTSKEAILRLGKQGGYLNPSEFGYVSYGLGPTDDDALIIGNDGLVLPYWYHLDSTNRCNGNCKFASERPPLTLASGDRSIERQVHTYVVKNLDFCLNDYKSLEQQGYVVEELGESELLSQITKEDFRMKLLQTVRVTKEGREYSLDDFFIKHDVNLRKVYEIGQTLMITQDKYRYLERNVLNLLASFSGEHEEQLPPQGLTSLQPGPGVYWQKRDVEQRVLDLLVSYTSLFQVPGMANYIDRRSGDAYVAGHYGLYDLPIFSGLGYSYDDTSVQFRYYDWWDPYFSLRGRGVSGELIGPEQGFSEVFSFLGFKRYANYYDLSYPIVAQVYDNSAFGGEGYLFQFSMESNIRGNDVLKETYRDLGAIDNGAPNLLCDPRQRTSGNITTIVRNGLTNEVMKNAQVLYACGSDACPLGLTNEDGQLTTQMPVCTGGNVIVHMQDFAKASASLTTELDKDDVIEVLAQPFVDVEINVLKRRYAKGNNGWNYQANPIGVLDNEVAILTLRRIEEGTTDPYEVSTIYQGGEELPTLKLLPGEYTIEGNLIYEMPTYVRDAIIVPKRTQTIGVFGDVQEVELPKMEFNESFYAGGIELNADIAWEVSNEDLEGVDRITFFFIQPIGENSYNDLEHEDIDRMSMIPELTLAHRQDLMPIITKQ